MKKSTFTTHNTKQGAKAASTTRCGFFVAFYRQVHNTDSGVIAFSVNRKAGLPLFGIVRGRMSMTPLFLFLTYQRGKDYISVHRIKSTNKMRSNTTNGLPTGESQLPNAELRQLLKGYLSDIGGLDSLKEDVFQLMESLVASMERLGLDSGAALHYFFICRCTVDLIADLESLLLQSSNSSQSCNS